MNKKDESIIRRYEKSSATSLREAYKSFLHEKEKAWKYCEELCRRHNGKGLKVLGTSNFFFSAGFVFTDENNNECLMYITHGGDRKIVLGRNEE